MSGRNASISRRDFILRTSMIAAASSAAFMPFGNAVARVFCHTKKKEQDAQGIGHARIALIIDDVGYNTCRVYPFVKLGVPITFSILPRLLYSERLAETIHLEGHEIMLHQPMQPYNQSIDPGPGALYLNQRQREQNRIIEDNIKSFPFAVGVNNHMGSRFTESSPDITAALRVFREREFFFIDSVTTRNTIAYKRARSLHMRSGFRDVFIDNCWDESYVSTQLEKLKRLALRNGFAIGIGHPRPETARALETFIREIDGTNISLSYVSQVVYHPNQVT